MKAVPKEYFHRLRVGMPFCPRPDGQKKAYVRLAADYDALDVANKVSGTIVFLVINMITLSLPPSRLASYKQIVCVHVITRLSRIDKFYWPVQCTYWRDFSNCTIISCKLVNTIISADGVESI